MMRRILSGPAVALRRLGATLFYRDGTSLFHVLAVPDFRNLWTGQMISMLGDAVAYNTMLFAIIRMADDAGKSSGEVLGMLAVIGAIPTLILGLVAGTVADRADRKHVMIAADLLRGVLTLSYLFVDRWSELWIFFVASVLSSVISTFFYPARTALVPMILSKKELLAANAFGQLTHTLSFVVGAALAGVLVGLADATAPAFIIDSLSFFVSAYFILRIRTSGRVPRDALVQAAAPVLRSVAGTLRSAAFTTRAMAGELVVGVRYTLTDPIMRGVLISFLAMMLGLGAANVTFVPLLIDELGMNEAGIGPIRFAQTAGIILSSTAISALAARYRARNLIGLGMLAFGVTTVMVAVTENFWVMLGVMFLVGLAISPPQIIAATLMQQHVPQEKLGRASGAQNTIVNVANIASMGAAGYLMDRIGARSVFASAGLVIFLAGIVSWWALRGVEDAPPVAERAEGEPEDLLVPEPVDAPELLVVE
ncbi:MFS transporter [Aggregatilinea lenta]|uniref:MFS transporter n=1 Tax=Aggregatilinea lenta TaxID=913108 RepID=UPI000E5B1FCE|nr:MFS transporter [Aggregatilinea lenta]